MNQQDSSKRRRNQTGPAGRVGGHGGVWRGLGAAAVVAVGGLLGGCGVFGDWGLGGPGSGNAELTARSLVNGAEFVPGASTVVYRYLDANTADVYITDLPLERLMDPADDLSGVSGSLVQVYVFLVPSAGKTPIDVTACNAAVRHALVVDGAKGVYTGGGFVFMRTPGGDALAGEVSEATLRLSSATPEFADRLGTSLLRGEFVAERNDATARALGDRMGGLLRRLPKHSGPGVVLPKAAEQPADGAKNETAPPGGAGPGESGK
ncbi:MAG: hypothetical protein IOD15_08070 [Phycisphaerales bacterium]|jgi:hypothetical protein|nr:hypothetical protein [Phycisphaerales bacterium]